MALTQVGGVDQGRRLIIVLEDRLLRESLSMALVELGYRVAEFQTPNAALAHIETGGPADALAIDSGLAGEVDDPLARLHAARCVIPVIILSQPDEDNQAAERWGAVGVMDRTQPIASLAAGLSEAVVAGVPLSGRRSSQAAPTRQLQDLRQAGGDVFWKGCRLDLDQTEQALLAGMTTDPGTSLTFQRARAILAPLDEVTAEIDPERVRALIRRLRKKFREVDPDFDHIVFVPGRGYCWRESSTRTTELVQ